MVDPAILRAWLSGRSIARGLPAPVDDGGGFRIDTNSEAEVRRWIFPQPCDGLAALAQSITQPRHVLKLCDEASVLRSIVPDRWQIQPPGYFMRGHGAAPPHPLPDGYRIAVMQTGPIAEVRLLSEDGVLAASGVSAETADAFVYDRIVTEPAHRRKGLGRIVMATLGAARRNHATPELLVASEDGKALYAALGWDVISDYSTASISPC